jgi:hypothetical protein
VRDDADGVAFGHGIDCYHAAGKKRPRVPRLVGPRPP